MQALLMKKIHVRTILGCVALGAVVLWLIAGENTNSEGSIKLLDAKSIPVKYGENDVYHNAIPPRESPELKDIAQPTISVNTLDDIYVKLFAASPDERLKTLDIILHSPTSYFLSAKIVSRLEEMVADDDARIVELAQIVLVNIEGVRSADDMKNGFLTQNDIALNSNAQVPESVPRIGGMTNEELEKLSATMVTQVQPDYAKLNDPDASARGHVIAEAMTQRDEHAANILYKALQDVDANNRLLAVDGLQQILSAGAGDSQYIMAILKNAINDPDPKVALMAQQAIGGF